MPIGPIPPPTGPAAALLRALRAWAGQRRPAGGNPPEAATAPADRRAHARTPLDCGALLELPNRRMMAVNLLDLSEGGAGVEIRGPPPPTGLTGRLVIDTAVLRVRVARAEGGRVGLAFLAVTPDAAAALRRIIARTGFAIAA